MPNPTKIHLLKHGRQACGLGSSSVALTANPAEVTCLACLRTVKGQTLQTQPEPRPRVPKTLTLDAEVNAALVARAKQQGVDQNVIVNAALRQYLGIE